MLVCICAVVQTLQFVPSTALVGAIAITFPSLPWAVSCRYLPAVPPASITLSQKGNNHFCTIDFKWIICSDPKEKWLSLSSLFYLQHWSETAGLPGQSTPAESQNPHSGWGHSSSGFGNWCPDSVHAEDSVQRQHRVNHRSPGKHHPGLWQVKTFLSRRAHRQLMGLTPPWCEQ